METSIDSRIKSLILKLEWPGIDAITFGDGVITLLEINFYSKGKHYIGPIVDSTIDSYLKYNADNLSSFDVFARSKDGNLEALVGAGSYEGEGIIYVLNTEDDSLVWFAFFQNSESFESVSIDENNVVNAISADKTTWKLPVNNPIAAIELIYPDDDPKWV